MFNLVLFGPPGSGKGTQAAKLVDRYNLVHLSTGDMLREEMRQESELGNKVKALIENGELVSDEIVIALILLKFRQHKDAAGFIFDGFPRTVEQAKALDAMLEQESYEISMMATLEVEEEELVKRIMKRGENSGRADDNDSEVIKNRIKVYREKTEPVADYYKKQGKHVSVSNMGSIEITFDELCRHIDKLISGE
jgi:adenylate kinase